jgi:hypothetical protein
VIAHTNNFALSVATIVAATAISASAVAIAIALVWSGIDCGRLWLRRFGCCYLGDGGFGNCGFDGDGGVIRFPATRAARLFSCRFWRCRSFRRCVNFGVRSGRGLFSTTTATSRFFVRGLDVFA